MSVVQSFFLGLIQGIAEFLPISSSGHLKIAQEFFGLSQVPLLFDVILHVATLLAVFIYFRKILWRLICVFFRFILRRPALSKTSDDAKINSLAPTDQAGINTILMIILTTIVTGVLGIITKKLLDEDALSIKFIYAGFLFTSFLLIISAIATKNQQPTINFKPIKWYQALIIGIAQGIGTLPGISRSGSTIAGAQLCGVSRSKAGDYSFIASIPAILGAFILTLKDYFQTKNALILEIQEGISISLEEIFSTQSIQSQQTVELLPIIVSFLTAFIFGYVALALLMKLINKGKLEWFALYLIPAGIIGLIL